MPPATAGREVRALMVERDGVQLALLIDKVLGLEPLRGLTRRADEVDLIAGHLAHEGQSVTLVDMSALVAALGRAGKTTEVPRDEQASIPRARLPGGAGRSPRCAGAGHPPGTYRRQAGQFPGGAHRERPRRERA